MKILAIEKEKADLSKEDFLPHLRDEAEKVLDLYLEGCIREIYFDEVQSRAVLILETAGKKEAENLLSQLPLVSRGLISFEIIELNPYKGFLRLVK